LTSGETYLTLIRREERRSNVERWVNLKNIFMINSRRRDPMSRKTGLNWLAGEKYKQQQKGKTAYVLISRTYRGKTYERERVFIKCSVRNTTST
jgi:hypothetical protein